MTLLAPGHALFEGEVWHRRTEPAHRFTQRVAMAWLDLDELDGALSITRWFSDAPWAPVRFRRADHHGDPAAALGDAVRDRVAA